MTVPLDVRNDIRSMDADGVPRAEIAKRLRVSRNTVAKYADRLRQLPCRHRRRGARPQAAGGDAAALERPPVRRGALAGVGVHVRGAGRDIRALGARPQGDGPRQRHRGGQDGPRRGHRVEAVLAVQGPLPLRGQVLQPLLRQREGLRRERRRVLAAQPLGSGPVLRVDGGAQPLPRRGVRRAQRRLARPRRQAGARGPRRRPRRDARCPASPSTR